MRTITAAGLTFQIHERSDWQSPKQPVTGPAPYPDKIHTVVCHWPGAAPTWKPDTDVADHLRRGQASYLANKGFSYGYNFVIGPNGVNWASSLPILDVWEVRGVDIRNAANNGDFAPYSYYSNPNWNGYTASIQIMASEQFPATADQLLAFRYMVAWLDKFYGETLVVQPHRQSDFTSCPGDYLAARISALSVRPTPPLPPPPPPPPPGSTYTVVAGDSWYAIARKLSTTPQVLLAANPPSTLTTVLHPGDVLRVPGTPTPPPPPPAKWPANEPQTPDAWATYGATLPTPPPTLQHGDVNDNVTWWQAVFAAMWKIGEPYRIFDPDLIAYDKIGSGAPTRGLYGDASKAACVYWQSKNGLTADGVFGPVTQAKVKAVRGF